MMLVETATRAGARQYWWKALLALSLALNLFFMIGALWIRVHAPPAILSPEARLEQMAGQLNLNNGQREAFSRFAQTMHGRLRTMHKTVQPLIASAWSEIGRPGANEAKIMQLFDQAAEERRTMVRELTGTTLSFLATLTPEQRAQFVQLARRAPRPWSPSHDHDPAR